MTYPKNIERSVYGMLRAGRTINETARRAGVSPGYVKIRRQRMQERDRAVVEAPPMPDEIPDETGPIPYESLSPVAKDCLEDFERFRRRYFGRVSTPWQVHAAQRVVELLATDDEEYLVVNCPPGSGKSTLFTYDIPAWLTVRDRTMRGLMGSYGERVASAYTSRLRTALVRETPMKARLTEARRGLSHDAEGVLKVDYGSFKPATQEIWRREQFTVEQHGETSTDHKESTWTAFGKDSASLGWRADFVIWDDLFTTRMRTAEVIADLKEWWESEAEQRVEPGGLLVLQGQRLRSDDIYRHCLDKTLATDEIDMREDDQATRMYHHIVYKAHYDEVCRATENPSVHSTDAVPYNPDDPKAGGCQLDPKRVTTRKRRAAIQQGNYQTVYQQEDADPARLLVQPAWINGGRDSEGIERTGCWDKDRATGTLPALAAPGHKVRYITIDPSPTKFWSVQDWLYVHVEDAERMAGWRFLIDIVRKRMGANDLLDWANNQQEWTGLLEDWVVRSKHQGFPVSHLVMEKNAAQRWAMQYEHFHRWRDARGINVIPHNTDRNKADDQLGIEATLPNVYKFGRVRLPGSGVHRVHVDQLVTEVTKWPEWSTDDGVLSQWFGEYNLPQIATHGVQIGSIYTDMPSWVGRPTETGPLRRRITEALGVG